VQDVISIFNLSFLRIKSVTWLRVRKWLYLHACTILLCRLGNTLQGFQQPGRAETRDTRWEPRTGGDSAYLIAQTYVISRKHPKTAIECPVFLSIQCLLLTLLCSSSSYLLMMSAGLKHIVRDGELAGICRPRPAVPLGQATYWGRYSKKAESKKEQVAQLQQKAAEEYSHVRAAPEIKLAKLLAREIRSLSPLHSPPSSPVAGRQE